MTAPADLVDLVDRFARNEESYLRGNYNETQTRREFLDPLFLLLGWDMDNRQGYADAYKDVIHEDRIKVAGDPKAPDYCFRVGGTRKFFVEAKRPALDIGRDGPAAYQLRRYGWSSKLPLSVLTNFRSFALYDCRPQPKQTDSASVARVLLLTYREYPEHWDEIVGILGREAILRGTFDQYAESNKVKRGTTEVDRAFLAELDEWRAILAKNFALRNSQLTTTELNYAVQQTIDRIVFLRIAEDRGTEPYGQLRGLEASTGMYRGLTQIFQRADDRYNSGLFHFAADKQRAEDPDRLTLSLDLDDKPLRSIISRLYYPDSPYEFALIPADILGQIYERFLGKVIRLTPGHHAVVEDKPEVKKAGGVYYTPSTIVDYIVEQTLGQRLAAIDPAVLLGGPRRKSAPLTILDPACGSGSFLLAAYEYLLRWFLDRYLESSTRWSRGRTARIRQDSHGEWRLTTAERKRILLEHIYGVDVDRQAVEVTKLSLLLKVLEGETDATLNEQMTFFQQRALPDLDSNIRCGNSLVETDFYSSARLFGVEGDERVNPFTWADEFPEIVGRGGFDVIVGNPPWLMAGYYVDDNALNYLRSRYLSATGKFDLYYLFLEKSLSVVDPAGVVGMIVPNKLFHTRAAKALRGLLTEKNFVRKVVDFGDAKLFESATNYSAILVLEKAPASEIVYERRDRSMTVLESYPVKPDAIGSDPWQFDDQSAKALFDQMRSRGAPLESLVARFGTGVQTGADKILIVDAPTAAQLDPVHAATRSVLRGRDVRRYSVTAIPKCIIFPYEDGATSWKLMSESALKRVPNLYKYLKANQAKLSGRVWFGRGAIELSGAWYGLMYLDDREWFDRPHLLTPSLADRSHFALGQGTVFVTGTAGVTSIVPRDDIEEDLLYLLGVLNSSLVSHYITHHSPPFSGGYFKFSAPYLRGVPIPRIDFTQATSRAAHDAIVDLVKSRVKLGKRLGGRLSQPDAVVVRRQLRECEDAIDRQVSLLYDVTTEQLRDLEIDQSLGDVN